MDFFCLEHLLIDFIIFGEEDWILHFRSLGQFFRHYLNKDPEKKHINYYYWINRYIDWIARTCTKYVWIVFLSLFSFFLQSEESKYGSVVAYSFSSNFLCVFFSCKTLLYRSVGTSLFQCFVYWFRFEWISQMEWNELCVSVGKYYSIILSFFLYAKCDWENFFST